MNETRLLETDIYDKSFFRRMRSLAFGGCGCQSPVICSGM